MQRTFKPLLVVFCLAAGVLSLRFATAQSGARQLTPHQAHQIAVLVARHDDINLDDTHIELNSMDLGRDFAPGFYSFILIRESTSPGPDETLRRYAISRRTGDVWEMNLCTHYEFPELERMRHSFFGGKGGDPAELSAQSKRLGCSRPSTGPVS